jgi:hypothetical protein
VLATVRFTGLVGGSAPEVEPRERAGTLLPAPGNQTAADEMQVHADGAVGVTPDLATLLAQVQSAWQPEEHQAALAAAAEHAGRCSPAMHELLGQPDHPLIAPALELAGFLRDVELLPEVLRLAERRDLKIRALEAADAIDPFSDPELTELLGDSEREVVLAALSMAARRDDSMLQAQVDLLAHADDEIANAALASMPERIAPKWRPDLERLTQNDDPDVATRARQALLRVVDPGVAAGEDNGADRGTAEAPPNPGDGHAPMPSHEALLEQLNAADDEARIAALQGLYVLAKAEDGDRVAGLLGAANSAAVRKQACLVLGRLQDAHAARSLIDLLKETDDDGLKSNAHWALQRITGETLKPDADVWELWWQRVGKARATSKRRG